MSTAGSYWFTLCSYCDRLVEMRLWQDRDCARIRVHREGRHLQRIAAPQFNASLASTGEGTAAAKTTARHAMHW